MNSPSPLSYVIGMADEALTVRDLVGRQRLWAVDGSTLARDAAADLQEKNFDVAPVSAVPVERYVTLSELTATSGTVLDVARVIDEEVSLEESNSLALALARLREAEYYFMTHRGTVTGVVTRADIAKPAVALYVLGLVLSFERGLDGLIQRQAPDRFLDALSEGRASDIEAIYDDRRSSNVETSLIDCLNLDDRLTIARKLDLHRACGFGSTKEFRRWSKQLKSVRNGVAHGSGLLETVADPLEALDFLTDLRKRCERVWEEADPG